MKAVVVGASSGLGRCIGTGLAQGGASVAMLARRQERLEAAAAEAGNGALAIRCDVTDAASCKSAIDEAAKGLGGIDALIYATGVGPLSRIENLDKDTFHWAFDTNVIGANTITAAALPHLKESAGTAAYLSSISTSQTAPWPGLAGYLVSKAALDKLVECWRTEHPTVGFSRIVVGDCAGGEGDAMTEFANAWDVELATELGTGWFEKGLITGQLLPVEELVRVVDSIVRGGALTSVPTVIVQPRPTG
ncbi:MAG TPA: SDR family oxidoreductase [Mycobacteriales bacterium]|jgi:NADP-dependent 3-hydroxy acid dehydrogenase YdfG|nr:SDR family oxidoreductase [Mycobacteriales bacterium]